MKWQDLIIGIGSIVFVLSLIPMLRARNKPPLSASIPTSLALWSFVVVYGSYELWFSVGMNVLSASGWLALAIQRLRRRTH